jgi:hypothetical protein
MSTISFKRVQGFAIATAFVMSVAVAPVALAASEQGLANAKNTQAAAKGLQNKPIKDIVTMPTVNTVEQPVVSQEKANENGQEKANQNSPVNNSDDATTSTTDKTVVSQAKENTNNPLYWGEKCTKTEIAGEVLTYTVTDSGVTKVIVKGGTSYVVYDKAPFTNLTAPVNPNNDKTYAISHVIVCKDPVTPTDPEQPVDPQEPTDPKDPSNPVDPQEPTTPDDGGKGAGEPAPEALPNTGNAMTAFMAVSAAIASFVGFASYLSRIAYLRLF